MYTGHVTKKIILLNVEDIRSDVRSVCVRTRWTFLHDRDLPRERVKSKLKLFLAIKFYGRSILFCVFASVFPSSINFYLKS